MVNLLDNAIKYTPEGGRIHIRVLADGRHAIVEVEDSGIGIPANALPKIFSRFYRADSVRKPEFTGVGLGLSIVESIAHAHGGKVEVESSEGKGSIFKIILPLVLTRNSVDPNRVFLKLEAPTASPNSMRDPL